VSGRALAVVTLVIVVGACAGSTFPQAVVLEGRAPTRSELRPSVEALFERESYAPGTVARLVTRDRSRDLTLQLFRVGSRTFVTRRNDAISGTPVTGRSGLGPSRGRRVVPIAIGDWPSGLYVARLVAADGRVGFAPLIVRPRHLGEHRVAVVLPTLSWQAYNLRDGNGDGTGDSWYGDWTVTSVRLDRPYLNRGVPWGLRRDAVPLLKWLDETARGVDVLAQSDLEAAPSAAVLATTYDLIVFPGHHEYVTEREYDLVGGFRDRGGNLAFLASDNFYWHVRRRGDTIVKAGLWRELGRPEARLVGVQYAASGKGDRRPWIARSSPATATLLRGTGLHPGHTFGRGGIEIDRVSAASPRGVQVIAEIVDPFGPGTTAQMTYYETPGGARVFAAGAFDLLRRRKTGDSVSRLLENLWRQLAPPRESAASRSSIWDR
jgi:hypothetical protein